MSKRKTSELTGPLLDLAVGLAEKKIVELWREEDYDPFIAIAEHSNGWLPFSPTTDGRQSIDLIDKYEIALAPEVGGAHWLAWATNPDDESDTRYMGEGETAQIAICRAVVGCVFGDEVELPE